MLPVKTNKLIFPNGEFEGIWSSEELKFAKNNGYTIKVNRGYNFNKVNNLFTSYVNDLFKKKSESFGASKTVYKSLLNNLIGRFGLNINKPLTKNINLKNLDYILSTRDVFNYHKITEDNFLISYNPIVNPKICYEHGIDYLKVLKNEFNNNTNLDSKNLYSDVSIVISAMITSYSRIFMNKIKLEILLKGGKIYYTDTDSLVTDIPLENININYVGNKLGQFKLEHIIKEGYFISNKTYCILDNNDKIIKKCKGINANYLSMDYFKSMYFYNKDIYSIKTDTIKNINKGFVLIREKKILLKHNAFTKRKKIYSSNGSWIDTIPIIYNNINKNIVNIS